MKSNLKKNKSRRSYRMNLEEGNAIDSKFYNKMMTYTIGEHSNFAGSKGTHGSHPLGEMIGCNGNAIDDFTHLGFERQVNLDDPLLVAHSPSP